MERPDQAKLSLSGSGAISHRGFTACGRSPTCKLAFTASLVAPSPLGEPGLPFAGGWAGADTFVLQDLALT